MGKKSGVVKITEQSFQGAGGRDIFGKLKMLGPVILNEYHKGNIEYLNEQLIGEAKRINANYLFDVKYKEGTDGHFTNARGTAYRKRNAIGRFFTSFR